MKAIISILIGLFFILVSTNSFSQSADKKKSGIKDQQKIKLNESPRSIQTVSSRNNTTYNVRSDKDSNHSGKFISLEKRKIVPVKKYSKNESKKATANMNKL